MPAGQPECHLRKFVIAGGEARKLNQKRPEQMFCTGRYISEITFRKRSKCAPKASYIAQGVDKGFLHGALLSLVILYKQVQL